MAIYYYYYHHVQRSLPALNHSKSNCISPPSGHSNVDDHHCTTFKTRRISINHYRWSFSILQNQKSEICAIMYQMSTCCSKLSLRIAYADDAYIQAHWGLSYKLSFSHPCENGPGHLLTDVRLTGPSFPAVLLTGEDLGDKISMDFKRQAGLSWILSR